MFLKSLLPLLFLLLSGKLYAYEFPVEIFEYIDDTKVVVFINKKDIDKSLQWYPFKGAPPLTMTDMLTKMKKYLASGKIALSGARITGIELKQIPHHKDNWHYLVKLKSNKKTIRYYYFIVLMNGKIIPAVKEVESFK